MPTKARDYIIQKKLARKRIILNIHNGNQLKKRILSKNHKNINLGSLSQTKKTGRISELST